MGGDSFLLIKTERHYSEWEVRGNSIFCLCHRLFTPPACENSELPSMRCANKITSRLRCRLGRTSGEAARPKGALTQTSFAVRPGLRVPAPCAEASRPCDPGQPSAGWIPETCRRSITTKGADPLPSTPSQPYAGWMRSRKGALPPSRPIPASGFRARHHDQRGVPAPCGVPIRERSL